METEIWRTIRSEAHDCSEINFWNVLKVWNKSPNLINKRIFGVQLFDLGEHDDLSLYNEILNGLSDRNPNCISSYLSSKAELMRDNTNDNSIFRYHLFAKIVLFKKDEISGVEISLLDKVEKAGIFNEYSTDSVYSIQFREHSLDFRIPQNSSRDSSFDWYCNILLPKLLKWMSNFSGVHSSSIALVPLDQYQLLYNSLKKKYSSDIKQIWTEVTDPDKFIHEDIAIASYLLLLWKDKPPQRFVDLGCGNGLLVHILNGESHLGIGYDLRARKIWSKYPSSTILKVKKINPSKNEMIEEVDWIIGNHSDELTPWIPAFAAFNSPTCNFFLLPCCAFEFDGSKFRRNDSSKSLYNDYLDYIENICVSCGFNVSRDKLRIPSTKRICFVSNNRYHEASEWDKFKDSIDSLIEKSSTINSSMNGWGISVKLRDSEEKVRNCTQIDQELKETLVKLISDYLLQNHQEGWNEGRPTPLDILVRNIPSSLLKQIKNEGKGLQTFIKNHHHIFKIHNGLIYFRKPTASLAKGGTNWKTKTCWFYSNHPDSCPLEEEECSYRHAALADS